MATVSGPATPESEGTQVAGPLAVGRWRGGDDESKSDKLLAKRLADASADYKGVALTTFVLAAAVAGLVWLACGILIEHWLIPGGLSPRLRWAWLIIGLAALMASAVRWLLPLVRYRVNLVYAARVIEREHPELHNDLVNTVLVKAHPEASTPIVVRSLERRAAKQLSGMPADGVIDRTAAVRLACALAALVGLACLYEVFAPKSLLVSGARLLAPWVGWAAPSRVLIESTQFAWRMPDEADAGVDGPSFDRRRIPVEGGAATITRGRQVVVVTSLRGLRRDEQPAVVVTPLREDGGIDAAAEPWRVALARVGGETGAGRRFSAVLPAAARPLDRSVEIVIAAGDARSEPLRVAVIDSPSLLVRELRYDYPAYTRRQPETVEWQGDIRAVEGTQVTLVAESNHPLDTAWIDFDCDGDHDLAFTRSGNDLARVTKTFTLGLNEDRSKPVHGSYRLMFKPKASAASGQAGEVVDPLEHRIEVVADVGPEVAIEEPRESPLRVPPAAPISIRVRAMDPDFGLARVAIETRLQGAGGKPDEILLLTEERPGVFKGTTRIVPERLGAGPGSVLEYRAVATDTRPKEPNVATSPWQSLRIDASAPPRQPEMSPPPPGRREEDSGGKGESAADSKNGAKDGTDGGQRGEKPEAGGRQQPQDQNPQSQEGDDQRRGEKAGNDQAGGSQRKQGDQQQQQQQGDSPRQQPERGKPGAQQQGGSGEGESGGDAKETAGGGKRGSKTGAGENQGQGADQGQGLGQQGERAGGQPADGRQSSGDAMQGGGKDGEGKDGGQNQKQTGVGEQAAGEQDAGGGGQSPQRTAVSSDGTNDGEAMERILDHRRRSGGEKSGGEKSGGEKSGGEKSGGEKSGGEKSGGEKSGGEKSGGEGGAGQPREQADGVPSGDASSPTGSGGWAGGDGTKRPEQAAAPDGPPPSKEVEWGEQDLSNARNAADLAIEHLRDAVASGQSDMLDELGWTRDQARAFLDRWEAMRRLSESSDPVARADFERAVRSLGLRPDGVRSSRDVPTDVKGGQAEGRRSRPPSDYREQFKAYTQGTSGE